VRRSDEPARDPFEALALINDGVPADQIAARFGVTQSHIYRLARIARATLAKRHAEAEAATAPLPPLQPITRDQKITVAIIRSAGRYAALREVAAQFGITPTEALQRWHRVRRDPAVKFRSTD